MTLGELLKSKRTSAGLTLEELSESSGVSKSYLHEIEGDKSSPSILICAKLSIALGISVNTMAMCAINARNFVRTKNDN